MEHGEITHEGVTVTSNQQTSEEMRASMDAVQPEPVAAEPAAAQPEPAATPEKRPNPRKDLNARVEQLSAEVGNKNQTIETLNARLAEIDGLKREIEALKAPKAPATQERREPTVDWSGFTAKEPTPEQFENEADPYGEYLIARAEYRADKKAYERQQIVQRTQRERAEQHALETRADAFMGRFTEVNKADETFSQRIETLLNERGNPPMPPPVFEVLTEAACGPQLMLHLLEHPDDLDRVLHAPTAKAQYGEMKKLEARVEAAGSAGSAPPVKRTTTAHPPINPVVGSHPAPHDGPPGDDASYEEHEAYWNAKDKEARLAKARR
jgi:hypothetical protein